MQSFSNRKPLVAVIGASKPKNRDPENAYAVGRLIAEQGWVLVCGGLEGVMEKASQGAAEQGGIVVGILPGGNAADANPYVTIPIATKLGYARNAVIAQAADALIAVGGGPGTLSEIGHSLALRKFVVGLESWMIPAVVPASSPEEAVRFVTQFLRKQS